MNKEKSDAFKSLDTDMWMGWNDSNHECQASLLDLNSGQKLLKSWQKSNSWFC